MPPPSARASGRPQIGKRGCRAKYLGLAAHEQRRGVGNELRSVVGPDVSGNAPQDEEPDRTSITSIALSLRATRIAVCEDARRGLRASRWRDFFRLLSHHRQGACSSQDQAKARNRWIVTPRVGRPGLALRRTYAMLALQLHRATA
jgi:hypothetical protein